MAIKNLIYPVILAGGSGTRFWPMSRKNKPKQFLDITGGGTLLQQTLERILPLSKPSQIIIVTGSAYKKEIQSQIKKFRVPVANILCEPSGKNTAPAILWAANFIHRRDPKGIMAVLPSDHLIQQRKQYLSKMRKAAQLAQKGFLVTLGINPTRPETGYGYLKTETKSLNGRTYIKVAKFTEKPNLAKAKRFIKSKKYYWNSGMFVWSVESILEEFDRQLPRMVKAFNRASSPAAVRRVWPKIKGVSVDYGILEHAKNVAAVPSGDIGWSDLGSWESLKDLLQGDRNNNVLKQDVFVHKCKDSLLWSTQKFVAGIGLENIVVIDTPDALLVCRKELSQDVREVVDYLKKKKREEI